VTPTATSSLPRPVRRLATLTRSSTSATSRRHASTLPAVRTTVRAELGIAPTASIPTTPSSFAWPSRAKSTASSSSLASPVTRSALRPSQAQTVARRSPSRTAADISVLIFNLLLLISNGDSVAGGLCFFGPGLLSASSLRG